MRQIALDGRIGPQLLQRRNDLFVSVGVFEMAVVSEADAESAVLLGLRAVVVGNGEEKVAILFVCGAGAPARLDLLQVVVDLRADVHEAFLECFISERAHRRAEVDVLEAIPAHGQNISTAFGRTKIYSGIVHTTCFAR